MHGDFSRRTFDAADAYRSVQLQQGRVLLDADFNEQADITAHHDEARTADIVGNSGGPAAVSGPGPFAVTAADGSQPAATAWDDLRITPGTYYVGGRLVESAAEAKLVSQPHLPTIGSGVKASPGLPEPTADRVALYLDVWDRHVTADEDPALLEVALGGPDTTTRAQTVWQMRAEPVGPSVTCVDLHDPSWLHRAPRPMAAGLQPPGSTADPCRITDAGGYQRLENQLYRVEVHDAGTFVWSRDNGSVVAGLSALDDVTATGATLGLDRAGRDEYSSFADGDLVEVTSTDMVLRGQRGYLARAGTPEVVTGGGDTAVDLPVTWLDTAHRPTALAPLGRAPIVRRWDGGPLDVRVGAQELEAGITVRFPNSGTVATGDHWLIPARTVRMAHGMTQLSGTIEWPPGGRGPTERPPVGPVHHIAPVAILERDGTGWTLVHDCRTLFPPLTQLTTIDLVGGDGQEAMPGDPLDEPVRVAVRNGGLPVAGAPVAFHTTGGHLSQGTPTGGDPADLPVSTGPDGVAAVRWLLDAAGDTTQTLTIRRLDAAGDPVDAAVVVTGRLSVAREVAWDAPRRCDRLAGTVQDALRGLARTRTLRLLGGDGQEVDAKGRCVPQPVRVVLDTPCGPLVGEKVQAACKTGLVAPADTGATPDTLAGTGATDAATGQTDDAGVAAFWWQPEFDDTGSATLDVFVDDAAPIRVSAQLDTGGVTPDVHISELTFRSGKVFGNDTDVHPDDLASGIIVEFDAPVDPGSVVGKPVARVELDLPWPIRGDGQVWSDEPVGFRTITLAADLKAEANRLFWQARGGTGAWLRDSLWAVLDAAQWQDPILGRFVLEGWAIVPRVGGLALTRLRGGRTVIDLPTDGDGVLSQWFRLTRRSRRKTVPDITRRTEAVARRLLEAEGLTVARVVEEPSPIRRGLVIRTEPAIGTEVDPGTPVTVVLSAGR